MLPYAILIAGMGIPVGLLMLVWERAPFVRCGNVAAYAALGLMVTAFGCSAEVASDVAYADARAAIAKSAGRS